MKPDEVCAIIHELQRTRYAPPSANLWSEQLPDMHRVAFPTVTFPKETLQRFRESYATLLCFASACVEKAPSELCMGDLLDYLGEKAPPPAP